MRQQRQGLLFLLPLALGLAACCCHAHAHAHAPKHHGAGFIGTTVPSSSRRPASASVTTTTATAALALPPTSPGGGHDDDLSSSSSHICHAWCGCARRRRQRQGRRATMRLWATKEEADTEEGTEQEEAEAPAAEEEEAKELTPEEKQRNELKAEIKELEAALAKKRNELTEAQDRLKTVGKEGYMRLAAEVETYKRRRADGLNFVRAEAGKEAVKQLVPVLDLFEELEAKYAGVSDENSLKVLNGYRNLQNVFVGKAERLGLKPFTVAEGDAYDPTTMEADFTLGENDDVVLSVSLKGYEVGGRVVRRAGVTVSVTEATMKSREGAGAEGGEEAAAEEPEAEAE